MNTINDTHIEIIREVMARCYKHGITFILGPGPTVDASDGVPASGYFDESTLTLACALGYAEWFTTLLHESNHLLQWAEGSPIWETSQHSDGPYLESYLDPTKGITEEQFRKNAYATLLLEMDCERRTIHDLYAFGFPEKFIYEYGQKSNAYVLFYHQMLKHRRWYEPENAPYKLEAAWRTMPGVLMPDPLDEEAIELSEHLAQCLTRGNA